MTSIIGSYRIEGVIGQGGMGVVYRAMQIPLNRPVALKVIAPQYAADTTFRERFQRESQLAASLDHPNVVPVYELGEDQGVLYSAMRLINGPDVRRVIEDNGPLAPERAVLIVEQVAAALDAAHARGLVHRDLKPANILLEETAGPEHAYLSDFGVVKRLGRDPGLTGAEGWIGSIDYVTPEQVRGEPVTPAADMYGLGAVLLTMLTGTVPFPRDDNAATLYATVNEPAPVAGLPAGLASVIDRAMAKDPLHRYPTAGDMAHAARDALTTGAAAVAAPIPPCDGAGPTRRWAAWSRNRRWMTGAVAAVVVIALALAGVFALGGGSHTPGKGMPSSRSGSLSGGFPSAAAAKQGGASKTGTGPVTVSFNGNLAGTGMLTLAVTGITRQGSFARLDLTVRCDSAGGCDPTALEWPSSFPPLQSVEMLDPVNKKIYQPVRDGSGNVLVSSLPLLDLAQNHTYRAWVTFAAPPASVPSVAILFPEAGAQILNVALPSMSSSWSPDEPAYRFDQPAASTDTSKLNLEVSPVSGQYQTGIEGQTTQGSQTTVTLSADVLFAFNSATLSSQANQALSTVAHQISTAGQGTVTVTGYTDNIGTAAYNLKLSQRRAQAVVSALQHQTSSSSGTYQAFGKGEADPVTPNQNPNGTDNPSGRQRNRRVTVSYKISQGSSGSATPAKVHTAGDATTFTIPYGENEGQGNETYKVTAQSRTIGAFTEISGTVTCVSTTENTPCDTGYDFAANQGDPDSPNGIDLVNYGKGTTYLPADPTSGSGFGLSLNPGSTVSYWNWYLTSSPGQLAVEYPNGGPIVKLQPAAGLAGSKGRQG